jgi:hypothetical protein
MSYITTAYQRFNTEKFPLPSEKEIVELEDRIGVALPWDYRHYVKEYNGGYFDDPLIRCADCKPDGLGSMYGIRATHPYHELGSDRTVHLFDDNWPAKILPIGSTAMGALIILVTEEEGRGEIYLKVAFGGFHFLADDIDGFFALLEPSQ